MKVYSIILAGGKGTRLWPISREEYPKQFCRILERSLFSMTVERALMFSSPEEILIVTNRAHEVLVKREIEDMGVEIPEENILLEPEMRMGSGRDTGPRNLQLRKHLQEILNLSGNGMHGE